MTNTQRAEFPGFDTEIITKLRISGLNSLRKLRVTNPIEISASTGLSLEESTLLYNWANTKWETDSTISNKLYSAQSFYDKRKNKPKISTGSKVINNMFLGGIETSALTEFYGASGSGKTQLCFTLSVMVQQNVTSGGLNGKVIYIDTEHKFSPERICQIAYARSFDVHEILQKIVLFRPLDSSQQEKNIDDASSLLEKDNTIKLLIVDSIISHYRSEYVGRDSLPERQHRLYKYLRMLANIAEIYDIAVVITNQIQSSPDYLFGEKTISAGGNVMAHASKYRIELVHNRPFYGRAKMVNSPYHPPSEEKFMISEVGICDDRD